jgi:molybdopterin synthase catalytic subunit
MTESVDDRSPSLLPSASVDATLNIPEGTCALTYTPIHVDEVINSVRDDGAGATAVFIGEFQPSKSR